MHKGRLGHKGPPPLIPKFWPDPPPNFRFWRTPLLIYFRLFKEKKGNPPPTGKPEKQPNFSDFSKKIRAKRENFFLPIFAKMVARSAKMVGFKAFLGPGSSHMIPINPQCVFEAIK